MYRASISEDCWHIGSTTLQGVEQLKSLSGFGFKEVCSSEKAEELIQRILSGKRYHARDNYVHPSHTVVYSFYVHGKPINC